MPQQLIQLALKGEIEELFVQKPRSRRPRIVNPKTVEKLLKELSQPEGLSSYKQHIFLGTYSGYQAL